MGDGQVGRAARRPVDGPRRRQLRRRPRRPLRRRRSPRSPRPSAIPTRRDIYLFVRANPGDHGLGGGRRLLAPPQRRPPPSRPPGGRGLPARSTIGRPAGTAPAGRPSASGPPSARPHRRPAHPPRRPAGPLCCARPSSCSGRRPPSGWPSGSARTTAARWPAHMSPGDGQRSVRAAMHAIADTLTAHGFAAHAEDRGDDHRGGRRPLPVRRRRHRAPGALRRRPGHGQGPAGRPVRRAGRGTGAGRALSSRARGDDTCAALA